MSDSLQPHGLQHARLPCPSPAPRAYSKLMSIESVTPSNHLILCCPLLLLSSIFPSIRVFSNESVLIILICKVCTMLFICFEHSIHTASSHGNGDSTLFLSVILFFFFFLIPITLKEAGMPSPEWTKRKKQTLKIGHGGTLDSAARGVLGKRFEWKFDVTATYIRKKY